MVKTIRIVIVAERPLFRDGLRRVLELEPDVTVLGEACDSEEAITRARELQPDILLVDDDIVRMSGLTTLRRIHACGAQVRTIFLTSSVQSEDTIRALQLGARGVVPKVAASDLLVNSIRAVIAGRYWVDDHEVADLGGTFRRLLPGTATRAGVFGLTDRDLEIVAMVVSGLTNRKIAQHLGISEDAVKHHLTMIFHKVSVSSRLELAVFAAHNRLLDRTS